MLPCLDAVGARSVVEVGAFAGDLTRLLVDWAAESGARVAAIDPSPQDQLVQLDRDSARAGADPRDEPGRAAAHRAPRRGDHRRRPQLLHGQRGAAPDRRAGGGRRAAAAAVPRRVLAARTARRLLRAGADPRGVPPAASAGQRPAASSRASRDCVAGGVPYPTLGGARGRPAQRRAHRGRGLRRRPRGAAPRPWCPAFFGFGVVWHRDAPWAGRRRPRSSTPGTATRCSSGWRRNRVHHLAAEPHARRPRSGGCRSARRVRRPCCGGCSSRAPSRSPSASRGCASAPASRTEQSVVSEGRDPPGAGRLGRADGAARARPLRPPAVQPRAAARSRATTRLSVSLLQASLQLEQRARRPRGLSE